MKKILVEVYDGINIQGGCGIECSSCACGCGSDEGVRTIGNIEMQYEEMKKVIQKTYGEGIFESRFFDMRHVDLADYPWVDKMLMLAFPYPLTFINGKPASVGAVEIDAVIQIIRDILKQQN